MNSVERFSRIQVILCPVLPPHCLQFAIARFLSVEYEAATLTASFAPKGPYLSWVSNLHNALPSVLLGPWMVICLAVTWTKYDIDFRLF